MRKIVIYVHGKGGSVQEAEHYRFLFPDCDVIGFAYGAQTPWEARIEFTKQFDSYTRGYDAVILVANSIGAFFPCRHYLTRRLSWRYSYPL